ncbi:MULTISPECIES: MFS transporter [Bacteria]|uniref:MFS transporter n=1 Tax=Bacteria TaxID=2 RepID=UPI00035D0341|nr:MULTISPECIES: MFS transporter [Bacteria]OEK95848.1 hypothetical protein AST08_07605 [Staphylococcus saprophyticus]
MLEILKNLNFVKLLLGRIASNIGDSIYYVSAMWLVYELGGSEFYTGLAGFLILLPNALQFLFGPIVDNYSIKLILVFTQFMQAILISTIVILYFYNLLTVTSILIIMPIIAIMNQFAYPAMQSVLPKIIKKDSLTQGNSLMSISYQGLDVVFNSVSGIFISLIGAISLLFLDILTFIISGLLFGLLKIPKLIHSKEVKENFEKNYFEELKSGLKFGFNSIISKFFLQNAAANFLLGGFMSILPAYADFKGGASAYGGFLSAFSGGMLLGSLLTSYFEKFKLGYLLSFSMLFGGTMWVISVSIPNTFYSMLIFSLAAIPIGITNVILFSVIQRIVPENLLGRVLSVLISLGGILMPIGSLIGGIVTPFIGVERAMIGFGIGFMLIAVYYLLVKDLRDLPPAKKLETIK